MRARILAILVAVAAPALAWEPSSPAAVQARIDELQKAWAGKSPEEIAQDKITRSRQPILRLRRRAETVCWRCMN